ncbi:hypothetical protein H8959_014768 [Pygathrix nigripes]
MEGRQGDPSPSTHLSLLELDGGRSGFGFRPRGFGGGFSATGRGGGGDLPFQGSKVTRGLPGSAPARASQETASTRTLPGFLPLGGFFTDTSESEEEEEEEEEVADRATATGSGLAPSESALESESEADGAFWGEAGTGNPGFPVGTSLCKILRGGHPHKLPYELREDDEPVKKRGRKGRGRGPPSSSDSEPEAELEREAKKSAKKLQSPSTEPTRKPGQKEKRARPEEKPQAKPVKVERTRKRSEGFSMDRKVEKKKEPSVEEKLQKLHSEIKFALKVDSPDVKRCLNALEELGTLQVTSQILQKNTDVVATLKKIRRYKANKDVMEKAAEVYTRLKSRVLGPKIEAVQKANKAGTEKEKAEEKLAGEELAGEEAPQEKVEDKPSTDLSAPVNGEATSQKGESAEDKEHEEGRDSEEGPRCGSSEDLHDSLREGPDLDRPGSDRQERERARGDSEALDEES